MKREASFEVDEFVLLIDGDQTCARPEHRHQILNSRRGAVLFKPQGRSRERGEVYSRNKHESSADERFEVTRRIALEKHRNTQEQKRVGYQVALNGASIKHESKHEYRNPREPQ